MLGFLLNTTLAHKIDNQTITLHDIGMKLTLNMHYVISKILKLRLCVKLCCHGNRVSLMTCIFSLYFVILKNCFGQFFFKVCIQNMCHCEILKEFTEGTARNSMLCFFVFAKKFFKIYCFAQAVTRVFCVN